MFFKCFKKHLKNIDQTITTVDQKWLIKSNDYKTRSSGFTEMHFCNHPAPASIGLEPFSAIFKKMSKENKSQILAAEKINCTKHKNT